MNSPSSATSPSCYNGDHGYEITYKGTRPPDAKVLADVLRRRQSLPGLGPPPLAERARRRPVLQRASVAANKPAEQVSILNAKNESVTLDSIPRPTCPSRRASTWRDPADNVRNTEEEVYDAYRPVQGIMTPFSITRFYNGDMSNQRFLNSVSYNQGLDDPMFDAKITYGPKTLPKKK